MNATAPKLNDGNVEIKLGEETLILKPSIHAAQSLSNRHENLLTCVERVSRFDFNVILDIISVAMAPRYNTPKAKQELAAKIYMTGLTDDSGGVATAVAQYVGNLMRGGRPAKSMEDVDTEDPNAPGN